MKMYYSLTYRLEQVPFFYMYRFVTIPFSNMYIVDHQVQFCNAVPFYNIPLCNVTNAPLCNITIWNAPFFYRTVMYQHLKLNIELVGTLFVAQDSFVWVTHSLWLRDRNGRPRYLLYNTIKTRSKCHASNHCVQGEYTA